MTLQRARVFWLVAAILLGLVTSAALRPPTARDALMLSLETSPGGTRYLRIHIAGHAGVRLEVIWPGELAIGPEVNQDVATVGSRLLLKGGAEAYPAGEANEQMNDLRAGAKLGTSPLWTWLRLDAPKANLQPAVSLINAHLRAPAMRANWFNRVRADVAADNREDRASPEWLVHEALRSALIAPGALRRSLSGEVPETVLAITPQDVTTWRQSVITRNPVEVIIAGDIGAREAGEAVDGVLQGLPAAGATPRAVAATANMQPRRILLHMPSAQTSRLILAGPLPSVEAGVRPEDSIILDALAGMGGVLYETARSDLRAAYSFDWYVDWPTDTLRYFRLAGEIETAKLAEAETALRKAYAKFLADAAPLHAEEAKARLLSDLEAARSDPAAAVDKAFDAWSARRDLSLLSDPSGYVAGLTAEGITRRLREAFPRAEDLVVIAVSPDANALPGACLITAPEQAAACR